MERRRIALLLEFDGTVYAGWQRQENAVAVQNVLEDALGILCKEKILAQASSRTDAGVHARGLVCHFDTTCKIPIARLCLALSTLLPGDISAIEAREVDRDFHARFSTLGKQYSYYIWNRANCSALLNRYTMHEPRELDVQAMQEAGKLLQGTHDFCCFMAQGSTSKTTVRTLYRVEVSTSDAGLVRIRVAGNGFLYNMVRIISGTLLYVGLEKLSVDDVSDILVSGDRRLAGKTLEAKGLFLDHVYYPEEFGLQWYNRANPLMDSGFTASDEAGGR